MRKLLLMAVLVGMMAIPVVAQFGRVDPNVMTAAGLMRENNADGLVLLKSVQTEIKLTDKQKEALTAAVKKVRDTYAEKIKEAQDDRDFRKVFELRGKENKDLIKPLAQFRKDLTDKQSKRLMQIRVQYMTKGSNPQVFSTKDVQTALKLDKKQQDSIKSKLSDLVKDIKELQDDAKDNPKKRGETFQKIQKARKDTYDEITKKLTKDQKTSLAELGGDKFEIKEFNFGGFGRDKGKKAKGKKKTDDD